MKPKVIISALLILFGSIGLPSSVKAGSAGFMSPDILVLGDSQLAFGSGPAFLDFFENISDRCAPDQHQASALAKLRNPSVGVIGVRSTSLISWVTRKGRSRDKVCKVDRKWAANAATFGALNVSANKYVQIGKGENYQFCKPGKSPFEAMFEDGYYAPKLLILSFLGNSAHRWAGDRHSALKDVERTMAQLPNDLPCIFMTTAPTYKKRTVDLRRRAQVNIKYAFMKNQSRCSFVEGVTEKTVAANLGNKSHFRRRKSGRVKDPYHPNRKAAEKFFSAEMGRICKAVFDQIGPMYEAQLRLAPGPQ
jgi:hypothetical protein